LLAERGILTETTDSITGMRVYGLGCYPPLEDER
jgi:hypothetical protein